MPRTIIDRRRIGRLAVIASGRDRTTIDLAAVLWQLRRGQTGPLDPTTRGEALASICADWIEAQDRGGATGATTPIQPPGNPARGGRRDEEDDEEGQG